MTYLMPKAMKLCGIKNFQLQNKPVFTQTLNKPRNPLTP
jgi:hypothetical protein